MIITVILFAVTILFGAIGALLMKVGAGHIGEVQLNGLSAVLSYAGKMFTSPVILGGMSLYFLSAAMWLYLLTKLDLSVVQPILALTYVVTPILAILFLHESVPALRWVGIVVIIAGVLIVARTAV